MIHIWKYKYENDDTESWAGGYALHIYLLINFLIQENNVDLHCFEGI